MRWFKPNIRNSIYSLLGASAPASESTLESSLEEIRDAMLNLLGTAADRFPHIARRIRYASDIQALWYLRGDLMGALAALHGEAAAREQLQAISAMFSGLLPGGMTTRPSPLR